MKECTSLKREAEVDTLPRLLRLLKVSLKCVKRCLVICTCVTKYLLHILLTVSTIYFFLLGEVPVIGITV